MALPFFSDPVRAAKGPDGRRGAGQLTEETRRDDPGSSVAEKAAETEASSSGSWPAATPLGEDADEAAATLPAPEDKRAVEPAEPQASEPLAELNPSVADIQEDVAQRDSAGAAGGDDAPVPEFAAQPSNAPAHEGIKPSETSAPQFAVATRGDTEVSAGQSMSPEPIADEGVTAPERGPTAIASHLGDASVEDEAVNSEEGRDERANEDAPASDADEQPGAPSERSQEEHAASQPEQDVPAARIAPELIWSSPEESEAAPEENQIAASSAASTEVPLEPRPKDTGPATEVAVWRAADPPTSEPRVLSAAAAVAASAPAARYEPPRQVQPALGVRRVGGYLRFAFRAVAILVLGYAALVLLLAVLYRWVDPPASALMVAQQLSGTSIEQRWVPLRRISPHLVQAVILSEDGAFCRHRGVDWSAVEEAMESTREGFVRGGSTITMQVVKNLFLWSWRSYVRKAIEIPLAYLVELLWPKARVLEIYLNVAEWGEGIFGAEAAARHHFGKSAASLTAQEAALLAVALPNPRERYPGQPGYLVRRLASNLQARMKTVRTTMGCVRSFAPAR